MGSENTIRRPQGSSATNVRSSAPESREIKVLRPGFPNTTLDLPAGSTLSDLLKRVDFDVKGYRVLVGDLEVEEAVILPPCVTVWLVPKGDDVATEPWRATFGMFRDDPLFQEMADEGRAIRDAEREGA